MKKIEFIKMHGLGNDFVIIDRRKASLEITHDIISKISDRRTGAGCDQIITIDKPSSKDFDAKINIFNSNGDEAEACGNGTRCVAKIIFQEVEKTNLHLESIAGILKAYLNDNGNISINMGRIKDTWSEIPLSKKIDTHNVPISVNKFSKGFAVNIGNPHIVFHGRDIYSLDLKNIGPKIENHTLFPNKTNVEFIEIVEKNKIKIRVWERGVGETLACGSGACASVYAGYVKGLNNNYCEVIFKKGSLFIEINNNNEVIMTGPTDVSFFGKINL